MRRFVKPSRALTKSEAAALADPAWTRAKVPRGAPPMPKDTPRARDSGRAKSQMGASVQRLRRLERDTTSAR